MSGWGTDDMAAALPTVDPVKSVVADAPERDLEGASAEVQDPQEAGWASPQAYNYAKYMMSSKELGDSGDPGDEGWRGNAAVYEWNEEYGDVGPKFEALEKQLFGEPGEQKAGINFSKIAEIEVDQTGPIQIKPVMAFEEAGLHPVMLENVRLAGYDRPTPIQQYTMPAVFEGHDIVACAQTGSGKTAAFLIPILSKLMGKAKKWAAPRPNPAAFVAGETAPVRAEPLVLIVAPSRELATQIFDEARKFCYRTMLRPCVVYGGGPMKEQMEQLAKGCDILIGSPGRLCDFINRTHVLTLKRLKYMVIDEADEMVNSDWEQELTTIMSGGDQEEGNITYMMFSATFPKIARELAEKHLAHAHVQIRVGRAGSSHANIRQQIIYTDPTIKKQALFDLLRSTPPARTIVFVNSKRTCDEVDDFLFNSKFPCTSIHSDRTQREREDSLRSFRNGKSPILIATGVSARGIDIPSVMHVINYDLPSPQFGGIQEYTHRIGRTGRIGHIGMSTSFYNERDSDMAEILVKTLLETHQLIPDFLEQYIPEGFNAQGEGDVEQLKFEMDDEEVAEDENNESAGGEWGGDSAEAESAPAAGGWGAEVDPVAEPVSGGWGVDTTPTKPVKEAVLAPVDSWGSAAPSSW